MNLDEFAFFNRQLAGMLKSGIPLEGGLRELCRGMGDRKMKRELEQLEADLAKGVPVGEALAKRDLPPLYIRMAQIGLKSNDLPGILLAAADYYERSHSIATRLKGLLVYPAIVLAAAIVLSGFFTLVLRPALQQMAVEILPVMMPGAAFETVLVFAWLPLCVLSLLALVGILAVSVSRIRQALVWRVPIFRDRKFCEIASAMALLLKGGCPLNEAIGLLRAMEGESLGAEALATWQEALARGRSTFPEIALGGGIFPPLFLWLVASAGEDVAEGFWRAAEIYETRVSQRVEMFLYGVMPVCILALGVILVSQAYCLIQLFIKMLTIMGQA